MKIGYILLCHKSPKLVSRIANRLTDKTNNIVVIHVDKKVDDKIFKSLLRNNNQVIFVEDNIDIFWGGFNSIIATMNALKIAINYECDRYVLLQGMDYPVQSNEDIANFFVKNKKIEFLKAYNITVSKRKSNYMKCYGYHIYDNVDRNKICLKTLLVKVLSQINRLGIKYRKGYYTDSQGKKYNIYWGWGHFALTHECVQYLINFYEENPDFNKYFKTIFPADETYIQTVIHNSDFSFNTREHGPVSEIENLSNKDMLNLTYFEYPKLVREFESKEDLKNIDLGGFLYIRKVNENSKDLLDELDKL